MVNSVFENKIVNIINITAEFNYSVKSMDKDFACLTGLIYCKMYQSIF